jgi:hypothetical protein
MIDHFTGAAVLGSNTIVIRPPREEVDDPTPIPAASYRKWFETGMPAPYGHLMKISKSKEKVNGVITAINNLLIHVKFENSAVLRNIKETQFVELKLDREASVFGQILSLSSDTFTIQLFDADEEDEAYYAMLMEGTDVTVSVFIEKLEPQEDKHSRTTDAEGNKVAKGTGVVRLIPLDEFNRPLWSRQCTRIYWTECDGFIPPANFHEFIDRWPDYIRAFLVKRDIPDDMIDEFHQELACFLMHRGPEVKLQEKQLIRSRKATNPKYKMSHQDRLHRVSLYNTEALSNNNNEKLFFSWLNFCMQRKLHQLWTERMNETSNPFTQEAFEDDPSMSGGTGSGIADAYSSIDGTMSLSSDPAVTPYVAIDTRLFLQGFTDFIRKRKPELMHDLALVMDFENLSEAARATGRSRNQLLRNRQALMTLAQQYQQSKTAR